MVWLLRSPKVNIRHRKSLHNKTTPKKKKGKVNICPSLVTVVVVVLYTYCHYTLMTPSGFCQCHPQYFFPFLNPLLYFDFHCSFRFLSTYLKEKFPETPNVKFFSTPLFRNYFLLIESTRWHFVIYVYTVITLRK